MLGERSIKPENLPPAEDIKKGLTQGGKQRKED